jgi:hypothetical protein
LRRWARELAQIAVKLGSPRLRETAYPDVSSNDLAVGFEIKQMRNAGYSVFYKTNAAGQPAVDFYFQAAGYHMPAGNLGLNYFWSSSLKPLSHSREPREAAAFSGETGSVAYYDRAENLFAVRCVITH